MNVYVTRPGALALTIVSPNGGEQWQVDSSYPIEWSWSGTITDVNLSHSTDGFTNISHTIALSASNSGIYTWTTPSTPSNSVRVRVADAVNPDVYDESDADFAIVEEPISGLVATNDSPTVLGHSTTFTATVTAGSNVVYNWAFGDGDSSVGAVATHTYPAVGTYTATVTASNSVGMLVKTSTVTIMDTIYPSYLPMVLRTVQ